jgi:hypothetical protein
MIIGLVIGAIFLLVILSIVIVIHIRQRRKRAAIKARMGAGDPVVQVRRFMLY